jgi:hypothetical protein
MNTSSLCIPGLWATGRRIEACRLVAREPAGVRLGGGGDTVRAEEVAIELVGTIMREDSRLLSAGVIRIREWPCLVDPR